VTRFAPNDAVTAIGAAGYIGTVVRVLHNGYCLVRWPSGALEWSHPAHLAHADEHVVECPRCRGDREDPETGRECSVCSGAAAVPGCRYCNRPLDAWGCCDTPGCIDTEDADVEPREERSCA
jgi:hypothetical protein